MGVFRSTPALKLGSIKCYPHTHGGVPNWYRPAASLHSVLSPYTWGCSELENRLCPNRAQLSPYTWGCSGTLRSSALTWFRVIPIHMGVFRIQNLVPYRSPSYPHTHGGVPQVKETPITVPLRLSPYTWGCSVCRRKSCHDTARYPHTHGGVPFLRFWHYHGRRGLSPYTWGCSDDDELANALIERYPHTHGGVPETTSGTGQNQTSYPHTHGGVP